MFLGLPKNLRKTVAFRLTLWYSAIFILSSILLFALAYFLLTSSLSRQDKQTIQLKLKELSALYETGGIESLKRELTVEKKFEKKAPLLIRVAGRDNKAFLLVIPYQWAEFDIKQLERIPDAKKMTWIRLPAKHSKYIMDIASIRLTNDYVLQAGKSNEYRAKVMRHFREIFVAVMIPLVLLALFGGTFLAFRALRPVRHLINTIRSIGTGKMDARVPSPQTGDELEELVILFNGMLQRIEILINGMRDSLDSVAHDLRTPIARLRGIAEIALQSDQNGGICQEALSNSLEESERILKMLNTLMDISEAETGVMKLNRELVDVSGLMKGILDIYQYVAEEKDIDIHLSLAPGLSFIVDPIRISQAIANLLDNAIKYTPVGGKIDIEAQQLKREILIVVKDSGIGIPREEIPKIWDRLYRGDQSRSQRGLGLGLSLLRAIIRAHKGQIEVLSEPGKGSIFSIYLPAHS